MTTIYLIRHAEAEGNLYRRAHGHYDSTITDNGYRQIAALAKRFSAVPINVVYSSDLTRTQTTALSITRTHGLPLHTTTGLREVNVGEWEDRTWEWLKQFDRERLAAFNTDAERWHVSGGEDMAELRERITRTLREIIDAHPNQTVAVFSHGLALRMLTGTLQGLSISEIDKTGHGENTSVTKLEADGDGIRVIYRNDASHLPDALTTLHKQLWIKNRSGFEPGLWFSPDGRAEGDFRVMCQDDCVGAVSVRKIAEKTALLRDFRLDGEWRGKGFGIRLVGQAISFARANGCDTLRVELPPDPAAGLLRAEKYGFHKTSETAGSAVLEKYFGRDASYRVSRFDAAYQSL